MKTLSVVPVLGQRAWWMMKGDRENGDRALDLRGPVPVYQQLRE
jgi:hypothetical protein